MMVILFFIGISKKEVNVGEIYYYHKKKSEKLTKLVA